MRWALLAAGLALLVCAGAPGDVITSTIAWGDGSSSAAAVVPDGASWHITGSHRYGRAGSYPVEGRGRSSSR